MSIPIAVGSVIAERYRVDGIIGEGGMGVVCMATHLVLNQRVAIKFLRREAMADQDAVHRFVREAQAAAKIQSEHVVRVQDVAMLPDGTPYIVMEYLEGELLATILSTRGALPVREAIKYALQTCEALAETHAAGIVHGDLKPENIYIAGSGDGPRRVKLFDFGISKILVEKEKRPNPKHVMGTPAYMAPEQFESGTVSVGCDVWALGTVLYEMLTGTPPFLADTPEQIRDRVMSEPLTPVLRADLPEGLNVVISRCLQKEASLRYPTILDLTAALEDYSPAESSLQRLEHVKSSAVRSSQRLVPTVVVPNRKSNHGTWLLTALGLLAIVGLVIVLLVASRRLHLPHATDDSNATAAAPPAASSVASASPSASPQASSSATPSTPDAPAASAEPAASSTKLAGMKKRGGRPATNAEKRAPAPTPPAPTTAPTPTAAPSAEGDRFGTRK